MANTLLTIDQITRESLMVLHEKLTFIRSINRDYDDQFAKSGAKIGATLRIRRPVQYSVTDGAVMSPSDSVEQYTTLTVDNQKNVGIQFSSAELTLSIDEYRSRFIEPAMAAMAAKIEADCIERAVKATFQMVGTAGTIPATLQTYLEGRALLNQALAPKDRNRNALISSNFSVKIVDALKSLGQDDTQIATQYREGHMARAVGFDWAESESMYSITNGTQTMAGTVSTTVSTDGTDQLVVTGLGASKTVTAGTAFTIAGVYNVHPENKTVRTSLKQFVVTTAATSNGSGVATLTVSPKMYYDVTPRQNMSAAPQAGAVTTYFGALSTGYEQGLLYHKDAFTFATADLELPQGGATGSRAVYDGISMRIVKGYDITNDKHPARVDVLYGFAALRPSFAVRVSA